MNVEIKKNICISKFVDFLKIFIYILILNVKCELNNNN